MRARTFAPTYVRQPEPMMSLNMTPLIDVLLVLIVMMIVTVPIVTHKVPIDLPQAGPTNPGPRTVHRLDLAADGRLAWDGVAIADGALPARLAALKNAADADLHIAANADVRYERFDQTLATIKLAGITRLGFVGNERFARFDAR